jgi:isoquinoline 1-oxidoreductase beta subunit
MNADFASLSGANSLTAEQPAGSGGTAEVPLPVVSRRQWLKGAGAAAGLVLSVRFSGVTLAAEDEKKYGADAMEGGTVDSPLAFISIAEDGTVTILCHRPEMGQGIRTSLPLVVAEELEADFSRVKVQQAQGDEAKYGNQNTDGSRSMRHFFEPMRRAGAAARTMLEGAAAAQWGVSASEVHAADHEVIHASSGRRLGYGALAKAAAAQPVPARGKLKLKDPKTFRYIGKVDTRLVDGADIVRGRATYGIDTRLDGMLYAVIARPLVYGGKVKTFDSKAALAVPGVVKVVELKSEPPPPMFHPLGGVAVLARNTWAAIKGRDALKIQWDDGVNAAYDSEAFKATLEAQARQTADRIAQYAKEANSDVKVPRNEGDALGTLARASRKVEAEYYLPHLAHATMEPPAATAQIKDGKCEVWACVQAPQGTRDSVAGALGLKPDQVTVNVTLLGGAFGRKSMPDFAIEAALLSKEMNGTPVKVTWTREDDLRHDYYHTVSVERLEAALDPQGNPTAWLHRSVAPTIESTFTAGAKGEAGFEISMTAISVPYEIPNIRIETPGVDAHTRIGWFRSVSNIPHAFAVQCFVAELAAAAGRDPKDYLLELIGSARRIDTRKQSDTWNYDESPQTYPFDTGRLRKVIERVAQEARWGRAMPKGSGLGIAATYSFVTYVAAVVEVSVGEDGRLVVPRIDVAIDCGAQVNPDRVRSQVEGSCVMGVGLARTGEITFKNGFAQQTNFHEFQVARMNDAPIEIHVHSLPGEFGAPLGGVGEPALPPIAPALCNAIFAATGKRIRRLPIGSQLVAKA